jgi:hypothetical protein
MTLLAAVVALDNYLVFLDLVLGAASGGVTILVTIVALLQATADRLTSVLKTDQVFLAILGPVRCLTSTSRSVVEAEGDLILLVQVALKVHVGESTKHSRLLDCNDMDANVLLTEGILQLSVGQLGLRLDVFLNCILDIVHVFLLGGSSNHLPSSLGVDVGNMGAVDESGVLAIDGMMTCRDNVYLAATHSMTNNTITYPPPGS